MKLPLDPDSGASSGPDPGAPSEDSRVLFPADVSAPSAVGGGRERDPALGSEAFAADSATLPAAGAMGGARGETAAAASFANAATTPMFRQYMTAKAAHLDAILLFRMGDSSELDASVVIWTEAERILPLKKSADWTHDLM